MSAPTLRGWRLAALALVVGAVTAAAVGATRSDEGTFSERYRTTMQRVRSLRQTIQSFERTNGRLPGLVRLESGGPLRPLGDPARSAERELLSPRPGGRPYLRELPMNPFTGSRRLVTAPRDADVIETAKASRAGWIYVVRDRPAESLPRGVVLPCGNEQRPDGKRTVTSAGFRLEDGRPWR